MQQLFDLNPELAITQPRSWRALLGLVMQIISLVTKEGKCLFHCSKMSKADITASLIRVVWSRGCITEDEIGDHQ